jgi:geranylgeranyl reductase
VVLLDRRADPGGKACGGGITREGWRLAGLDEWCAGGSALAFSRMRVASRLGCAVVDAGDAFVRIVDRIAWQGWLIRRAREAGCDVRLGERLLGFGDGCARTDRGTIACGLIVGADGASSRVRRLLGLAFGARVLARQVTVPPKRAGSRLAGDLPRVFFEPGLFGAGYGWSFPAPDGVRLGCGAPASRRSAGELREAFHRWLGSLGVSREGLRERAGSIGCGYAGHRFGRLFLAGDAAGLASPVTGEGISQALISGAEVAREILEPGYRSQLIPALARRHRRTGELLAGPLGAPLVRAAGLRLRGPAVRREAVARYC